MNYKALSTEQEPIISLQKASIIIDENNILNQISLDVFRGLCLAIVGPSGSGKTMLGILLAGQLSPNEGTVRYANKAISSIQFVEQQHDFRDLYTNPSYYQQRFDQNYSADVPSVADVLNAIEAQNNLATSSTWKDAYHLLDIASIQHRKLIQLSNGESKRIQLAKALLHCPQVLVLDNPFIGLDIETRAMLHVLMEHLLLQGLALCVITSEGELPRCASRVLQMNEGKITSLVEARQFRPNSSKQAKPIQTELLNNIYQPLLKDFSIAAQLTKVDVVIGGTTILEGIDWTIRKGEHWVLKGANGSGKSTLLSLISGDNPQAYGKDIVLFDKKRGSGESIWDIKKRIGLVSPELHNYFLRNNSYTYSHAVAISVEQYLRSGASIPRTTGLEVIASGFYDQVGTSFILKDTQLQQCYYWMELFDLMQWKNLPFYKASLGNQRLMLLARALVKNPAMLLLDEPCQGLDTQQAERFKAIINLVCSHFEKTLIYVSHYPQDIPEVIKHSITLHKGKVKKIESL